MCVSKKCQNFKRAEYELINSHLFHRGFYLLCRPEVPIEASEPKMAHKAVHKGSIETHIVQSVIIDWILLLDKDLWKQIAQTDDWQSG